mgnify:CR=1 FL=1
MLDGGLELAQVGLALALQRDLHDDRRREAECGRVDVGEGFTVVVVDGQTLPTLVKRPLDPNDPAALALARQGIPVHVLEAEARASR